MIEKTMRRCLLGMILTVFCGVVFHAPLSVWLGTVAPDAQLVVKAWKEILIGLSVVVVMVQVVRYRQGHALLEDWVVRLAVAFLLLHLIMVPLFWQGVTSTVAGLMIDVRFVVFFLVVYAAVKIYPEWRQLFVVGGVVVAAVSLLFAVLQVTVLPHDILKHLGYGEGTIMPYMTVDQNYDFVRINGTLRGPNPLGVYSTLIAVSCVAALAMRRRQLEGLHWYAPWLVAVLGGAAMIAIWFSYSRSAQVALAIAVMMVLISVYGRRIHRLVWWGLGLLGMLVCGGVYLMRDTPFVSVVILHEDPAEGNDTNSNDGHWESLVDGIERMIRQPLGAGVGSTGSPSLMGDQPLIIENYYLYVAHEAGWIGLLLFILLFVTIMRRLWYCRSDWLALAVFAGGAGVAVAALVLPAWADDTVSIVWWGLAGLVLATRTREKVT